MTRSEVAVRLRTGIPPTPMQRTLLASQARHPTAPLQNMALLSHIDGTIDAARLGDAFARVVRASDVLRTTFVDDAVQLRSPDELRPTEMLALSRRDVESWAAARVAVPIDLRQGGYDSVVLEHEDGTASWYLALHHAVTDATSSMLVFDATDRAYRGLDVELEGYYSWWRSLEHTSPSDNRTERARRHWAHRAAAPLTGSLYRPVSHPSPASSRQPVDVDHEFWNLVERRLEDDLAMVSADLGWATLLTTVAAGYFHRLTGAERFAIGLPVHNRNDPTSRTLIGPLMEVYPVDVEIDCEISFRELHRRVGRAVMQTLRHARLGTAPSIADCEAVVNVITRASHGTFASIPTRTDWVHPGASDPSHLFRLQLVPYGNGRELLLDLNEAAVGSAPRPRACGHVERIFRTLVESPDSLLQGMTLCSDDELETLDSWGDGPVVSAEPRNVVDRLREALENDDHPVIDDGGVSWSGRDLWTRVVQTAGWLQQHGCTPDGGSNRVGIALPRSADAIVAIFATLLAGGSFVPLDPAQPARRRHRLAERAGCVVVLTELPPAGTLSDHTAHRRALEAYLMFTSGSTGEPKGVPVSHAGLARYVQFALDSYTDDNTPPVAPLFSALTFDLTITTLFVPLLAGGRLVVVRPDGTAAVGEVARTAELNWCKATPSHLELLLRLDPTCRLGTLVVGGEAMTGGLARRLWDAFPGARVFNEYGPTEAVVGCMIHEAQASDLERSAEIPIGRPAPGVHLWVVDQALQRVPIGATGELLISHAGVTEDYLDPDEDAFALLAGRRWYRSGDVVRMLDDDTLLFTGRRDDQFKIGGVRLDPSEVENALGEHPAVARATVRPWAPTFVPAQRHCVRCGLASNVPGSSLDDSDVCATCHAYQRIREQASAYFRTPEELLEIRDSARRTRTGPYDCLHLLSGGKDSTYAMYQLAAAGFDVLAVTLDNGFISEGAKDNIRRSVADLGIDHVFVESDHMDAIFRDSLERHSNVCHGCYKTIYTLATRRAVDLGIPVIVTGLSRGQLFETRLIPQQFSSERFDGDAIDRAVIEARRVYHRIDDAVNRLLDTTVFDAGDVFDRIQYVDFFRYFDVDLDAMLSFLERRAPWVRPVDTGRSTNCLINVAGIHTHLVEQGYHNYAVPYAWDVRLGHKTRTEAMEELMDVLDAEQVGDLLDRVGYRPRRREVLTAWIQVREDAVEPSPAELRSFLSSRLPRHAIPSAFVSVSATPMNANGKIDVAALPAPTRVHRAGPALSIPPATPMQAAVTDVFERLLHIEPVGVDDDFFELGGDSLTALQMIVDLGELVGGIVDESTVFTNPTPRQLASVLETLRATDMREPSAPHPRAPGEPPALTSAEQAMLFEQSIRPDDARYNVGHVFRIHGAVDTQRLIAAVRTVVLRHVPLHWTYSEPRVQVGGDDAVDAFVRSSPIAEGDLRTTLRRFHLQPFDLDNGPLARLVVQPLDDDTVAVALFVHHVSVDAQSFDLLWREVEAIYCGEALPAVVTDYADHGAWQRRRIEAPETSAPPTPTARTTRFRFGSPGSADGYMERDVPLSTSALRSGPGTTPTATALAALAVVLRRRTAGHDVPIGLTVSTRDHASANGLVGLFLNTVPLTVAVEPGATFGSVAASASAAVSEALERRIVPLSRVVADRRRRGEPLPDLSVLFALENWSATTLGPLHVDHEVLATGSAVADATFFVQLRGERVRLSIEYRGTVIDAATAAALLDEFEAAIDAAVHRPRAVAFASNVSGQDPVVRGPDFAPPNRLLHDLIREQALRIPDRAAVRFQGSELSYGELERRSNSLARALLDAGVSAGSFVGVFVRPGPDLIVGILGTLKCGAAYVPLDPAYPADRLRQIAHDVSPACIVTSGEAFFDSAFNIVDIARTAGRDDPAPAVLVSPDALAYVIHTSGSTGRPKGVMVRHDNIVWSTLARAHVYPNVVERFLLLSSFSFDSSMVGIFWTLCTGGTLVMASPEEREDVIGLVELIEREQITHLLTLPSLYRLLLQDGGRPLSSSLNTVIVAGEPCPTDVVTAHRDTLSHTILSNEYGPTEATVWSHAWIDDGRELAEVPIGRPVPGASHLVLDGEGRPVTTGEVGELYVGGPGIAAGYHADAAATAAAFVEPLSSDASAGAGSARAGLWYRTGDLVRSDPDGCLFFVGRVDRQLKVRGVRVEPGEVEGVLRAHDAIVDVVVGAQRTAGRERLTAWYVSGAPVSGESLRAHMARHVPPHMIPTSFVRVDVIPVLPNGKHDIGALARTNGVAVADGTARSADSTIVVLAEVWADVLGLPNVGPDDNFFDLGGDSIISMQIVARARARGVHLRTRDVFEHQTVRALATASHRNEVGWGATSDVVGEIPLTPIQRWFFDLDLAEPNHFNQSMWLELEPETDVEALLSALAAVRQHHEQWRSVFQRVQSGDAVRWRQSITAACVDPVIEVVDGAGTDPDAIGRLAHRIEGSLDIETGRVVGVLVCLENQQPRRLLVTIHHLVADAVSWVPILEDWSTAYAAVVAGREGALPMKSSSFQQWAHALEGAAASGAFEHTRSIWSATPPPPLSERTLRAGSANTQRAAMTTTRSLDRADTDRLVEATGRSGADGVGVQDVVLTALVLGYARRKQLTTIPVLVEGHGREEVPGTRLDLSRTVGWFTTLFPVTLDAGDTDDLSAALESVRSRVRESPDRGMSFGVERHLVADSPVAEVELPTIAFNYLGQLDRNFRVGRPFVSVERLSGAIAPSNRRPHLLGLVAAVQEGQLVVTIDHHPGHLSPAEASHLADDVITTTRALIDAIRPDANTLDFDLLDLSAADAARLESMLDQLDG